MEKSIQTEIEVDLSKARLHIYTQKEYKEDYQIPMLKTNRIVGVLPIEGCEVEGAERYSYDVSGMVSLKVLYEKKRIKKTDMEEIIRDLMQTVEALRQYMLDPDCLLLQPEYIFCKKNKYFFCYLPGSHGAMSTAFHELTEYFVKMLDYEDTEGIFLAYELHKATLQERYDLSGIMEEYGQREKERREEQQKAHGVSSMREKEDYGNIFSFTEEADAETETYKKQAKGQKKYKVKALRHLRGKRWGQWNDLILETDGQEEKSAL